jgi:hypothetical protein
MTSRAEAIAAILSVAVPLLAFWTVEVTIASGPHTLGCRMFGAVTNNGFIDFPGCLTYHIWIYLTILMSWLMAYLLLRNERTRREEPGP